MLDDPTTFLIVWDDDLSAPSGASLTAADDHWKRQPRDPGGEDGGRWIDSPVGTVKKAIRTTVAIFNKDIKHDDVIAESHDGNRRVRWDASSKKFTFEERSSDGWRKTAELNKSATYKRMQKETQDWFEPGSGTPEPPKTPSQNTSEAPAVPTPKAEPQPIDVSPAPAPVSVKSAARLAEIRAKIKNTDARARVFAEIEAKVTQKEGSGGFLTAEDIDKSENARLALAKMVEELRPLAEEELELLMARDGEIWGSTPGAPEWPKSGPTAVMQSGVDTIKMKKIRDSYVVNDKKTIEHNASLRSGAPSPAAKSWRTRVMSLIRSSRIMQDATVWRGAALPPSVVASLRPGKILTDAGIMSTDENEGGGRFYMKTRLDRMPGRLPVLFDVRVPAGTTGVDVGYGEFVFGAGTQMRIVSVRRDPDGVIRVTAEMLPGESGKK